MRTKVADGDAEMVGMLVDAKVDVLNHGSNVSAYIIDIARLFYISFARKGP